MADGMRRGVAGDLRPRMKRRRELGLRPCVRMPRLQASEGFCKLVLVQNIEAISTYRYKYHYFQVSDLPEWACLLLSRFTACLKKHVHLKLSRPISTSRRADPLLDIIAAR